MEFQYFRGLGFSGFRVPNLTGGFEFLCLFLLQGSFTCEASHGGVGVVGFRFRIEAPQTGVLGSNTSAEHSPGCSIQNATCQL